MFVLASEGAPVVEVVSVVLVENVITRTFPSLIAPPWMTASVVGPAEVEL